MLDQTEKQRQNFKLFMKQNKLTAYSWAKAAGITEGTIRSYLSGRSSSLNYNTLDKLSNAIGATTKEIIDPDFSSQNIIGSNYLKKDLFLNCMEKIDNLIIKNNFTISADNKRKLYLAWYELKFELNSDKKDDKQDEDRISAMIKLVS